MVIFGQFGTVILELLGRLFGAVVTLIFERLLFGAAMVCQKSSQENGSEYKIDLFI